MTETLWSSSPVLLFVSATVASAAVSLIVSMYISRFEVRRQLSDVGDLIKELRVIVKLLRDLARIH